MNYIDRSNGQAAIGAALERKGWKLLGWTDDKSDSMTDYYAPAHWDGVAVKGDAVACVDVAEWRRKEKSGKPQFRTVCSSQETPCPDCGGTGSDFNGWTFERAKADPRGFNAHRLEVEHGDAVAVHKGTAGVPLSTRVVLGSGATVHCGFGDVVSPLYFNGTYEKCRKCHGVGHEAASPREEKVCDWPTFQANPPRKLWHVERAGRVLASGVGLGKCGMYGDGVAHADAIAARIDSAASSPANPGPLPTVPGPGGVTVTFNAEKSGVELRFPDKPAREVLDTMKAAGWRWSHYSRCWYTKDCPAARDFASRMAGDVKETA